MITLINEMMFYKAVVDSVRFCDDHAELSM